MTTLEKITQVSDDMNEGLLTHIEYRDKLIMLMLELTDEKQIEQISLALGKDHT